MSQLVEFLCQRLRADDPEAFLGAGEVIREFRLKSKDGGGLEPWASRILAEPLSSKDLSILKMALIDALQNGSDNSASGAAAALSEFQDADLIPILRAQLHRQMRAHSRTYGAVWNLIQALERSGDQVLPSANSRSFLDMELALDGAREYLQKNGIEVAR